jgi:protein involved in polysaccharide export with SLBB domain
LTLVLTLGCFGCTCKPLTEIGAGFDCQLPRELNKYNLPEYVIEPPDVLLIDALRVVPLPPYRAAPLDSLLIQVPNAFPTDPIAGLYVIDPAGTVNLGLSYGSVKVVGMTIEQTQEAITKHLRGVIKEPRVYVALGQSRGLQQIRGEHLVRPDGKVNLGIYGAVGVAGMTVPEAKQAIESHLSRFLQDPEVSVDVLAYNSKVYYVIFDGGGSGQQVARLPVTGNDTVLDAISQVFGLNPVSDKHKIWVARPAPAGAACDQVLPVDWVGVTTRGRTETNYQLLPGDRVYVQANSLVTLDTFLARLFSPIERTFGITLLANSTVRSFGPTGTGGIGTGGF